MPDTATAKNKNRRIRQEALREQLAAQGHEQHVLELTAKLADESKDLDANMTNRLRIVIDTKLKLIDKYLPSLKAVEHSGEGGGELVISLAEQIRKAYDSRTSE
jgi:hypothetical protein